MNATRFAQKPLAQPSYNFASVPKPKRDLEDSQLEMVNTREDLQTCMAEMLLLCKEAIRRRPCNLTGSKPLSLEYLADRLDVDEPIWGLFARSNEGMMQGFCTVTTFTNYQQTFSWNSSHPAAFEFDNEAMEAMRLDGARKWDSDGSLARGLQQTVKAGSIYQEGIVWPRVAELGLLGALGCGRVRQSGVTRALSVFFGYLTFAHRR